MDVEFNERDWIELLTNISQDIARNGICKRISLIAVIDNGDKIVVASAIPGDMLDEVRVSIMGMLDIFKHGVNAGDVITGEGFMGINATRQMIERERNEKTVRTPFGISVSISDEQLREMAETFKMAYNELKKEAGLEHVKNNLILSAIDYSKQSVREYRNMNIPQRVEYIGWVISEGKEKLQKIMPNDDFSWWPDISDKDIQLAVEHT